MGINLEQAKGLEVREGIYYVGKFLNITGSKAMAFINTDC